MPKLEPRAALLLLALAASAARAEEEPAFAPEVVKADFADLYDRLRASHYDLYARRARDDYDALFAKMSRAFTRPLTRFEVAAEFQRFVAYGRVAHARIDFLREAFRAHRDGGGRSFPLWLRTVDGRVYVAADRGGVPGLGAGTEVLRVDGVEAPRWLARLSRNLSADNDHMARTLLEDSVPALAWLEFPEKAVLRLRVRSPGGGERTVDVAARSGDELAGARAAAPGVLDLSTTDRQHRLLAGGIGYLRPGPFYEPDPAAPNPWDPAAFVAFVDGAFEAFSRAGAPAVLIDLRDNPGGDNSFSDPMIAWFATRPFRFASRFEIRVSEAAIESNRRRLELPGTGADASSRALAAAYGEKRPGETIAYAIPTVEPRRGERYRGRVYLLVNRHSYSNTVLVAAVAQDYGFATVLGEETSDLATTYGALEQFRLPRTGIAVGFPKALIVRPSGSTAARGVIPDRVIRTPVVEPPDDLVLAQAIRIVEQEVGQRPPPPAPTPGAVGEQP